MLTTHRLSKSYGARTLFSDVSFELDAGSRYGLVGANGSGKSTLMSILLGLDKPTDGSVQIPKSVRMGALRQDQFLNDAERIVDVASRGDALVFGALKELEKLNESDGDPMRMVDLEEIIRIHDGYTLEARASWILGGLGIPAAVHREPLATLSGGFKLRVLLAQALLGGPELLLLDEPTNHLDILSIRWLEKFLMAYRGCAVVISHDQRFLDNITTHILDVDYGTVTKYTGNYAKFVVQKQAERDRREHEIAKTEAIIAHKRAYVERFRAKASKASQAQSVLKQLEKIEVDELEDSTRRAPHFKFLPERPSGKDVLMVEALSKSYGEKTVLTDVNLTLRRGERLGIIGPNGLGKSTLLRIAVQQLAPDTGRTQWGHEVRVGYFAQDHRDVLSDHNATPLEVMYAVKPGASMGYIRSALGRVLFSNDDVHKTVGSLSGGEAARLVFGTIMAAQPNVLVLDEPTNHLDLESIDALVASLREFDGTILFVSHDRRFVSDLATRILELTPTGPNFFPGTFQEYLEKCGDDHLDGEAVSIKAKRDRAKDGAVVDVDKRKNHEELKKKRNRLQVLPRMRESAFAAVEQAEKRRAEIDALFASPGFYDKSNAAQARALQEEQRTLAPKIEQLVSKWEAIESEFAELTAELG
ncbi:MAG: ABC-F family ATP-binding cassette domain-containing protein [Deltaproteobacteria bacterium]|nr:ABC-F family ATP-binding cassette domain-containing protein [Deltaproteobacteria bacterium]